MQCKAKIAMSGGPGCGKTYSAIQIAVEALKAQYGKVPSGKILVLDTEAESSEKYADEFLAEDGGCAFDIYSPKKFAMDVAIEAIDYAEKNGYEWLIKDSFSHFWMGEGGALERVGGRAENWRNVTPEWNRLIDRILSAKLHIICCMRLKVQYDFEKNEKGKIEPKRIGLEPIMRNDIEYVFDIYGTLDLSNTLTILKTRAKKYIPLSSPWYQPGEAFAKAILGFCGDGVEDRFMLPAEIRTRFDELAAEIGEEKFVAALKAKGYDSILAIPSLEAARATYKAIAPPKAA